MAAPREIATAMRVSKMTVYRLLHTGDLTHLSDPAQFDTLAQVLKDSRTKDVFYAHFLFCLPCN